jgi:Flp pilus assembly pilin Flp
MHQLFRTFWADDRGAILSIEFLLIATILVLGLVVGLTTLRNAVVTEFAELGNAILTLSQGFSISGLSGGSFSVDGSQAIDTPGSVTPPTPTPPTSFSVIDVTSCP